MKIVPSRLNAVLGNTLSARIGAETNLIESKQFFVKSVGLGFLGLGAGGALGAILYGYSYVSNARSTTEMLTSALTNSLSKIELHAQAVGNVDISPSELRIAPDQKISLSPQSRLKLDPNAKVLAEGSMRIQLPTVSAPAPAPKSNARPPTINNFTIFKSVDFQTGKVITGWKFLTSTQKEPTSQYCYYNERGDNSDVAINITFAEDGAIKKDRIPPKFDVETAFSKCVWFRREG
jgi:hypothetical protein